MKFVALISGGKDSIYSILQLSSSGHSLVAVCHLVPSSSSSHETDSHCFQTVGHQAVQAIADCINAPIYQRKIIGKSIQTDLHYQIQYQSNCHQQQNGSHSYPSGPSSCSAPSLSSCHDEVEDLYALLHYVKKQHPEIEAVSSGAILSNYQRLRVENVCTRLGLTSLAPLWQRKQPELLKEMCLMSSSPQYSASPFTPLLIKVASAGLSPSRHLGLPLPLLLSHLLTIGQTRGVNECGEGGEYETFVVDAPGWRKRIEIVKGVKIVEKRGGGGAGENDEQVEEVQNDSVADQNEDEELARVGWYLFKEWKVTPKEEVEQKEEERFVVHIVPDDYSPPSSISNQISLSSLSPSILMAQPDISTTVNISGDLCFVSAQSIASSSSSSLSSSSSSTSSSSSSTLSISDEVISVLTSIQRTLLSSSFSPSDVFYIHLVLNSMSDFAAVNASYVQVFPLIQSPSRACVEMKIDMLPDEEDTKEKKGGKRQRRVMADAMAYRKPRDVLHVQSISHWAPACIGPYSQCSNIRGLLFLAGQIGLLPQNMQLIPTKEIILQENPKNSIDISEQLQQAWLNCTAILEALKSSLHYTLICLIYVTPIVVSNPSALQLLYQSCHSHLRNRSGTSSGGSSRTSILTTGVPVLIIEVPQLPRQASVEIEIVSYQSILASQFIPSSTSLCKTISPCEVPCGFAPESQDTLNFSLSEGSVTVDETFVSSFLTVCVPTSCKPTVNFSDSLLSACLRACFVRMNEVCTSQHLRLDQHLFVFRFYYVVNSRTTAKTNPNADVSQWSALVENAWVAEGSGVGPPAVSFLPVESLKSFMSNDSAASLASLDQSASLFGIHWIAWDTELMP